MGPLQRIAFCVGIGIALCGFGLFLYTALPGLIQHNNWDDFDTFDITEEEMLKKFQEHPTYAAFYEKFPDAKEYQVDRLNSPHYEIRVGVKNFDNGIELILHMYYNTRNDDVNVNINCDLQDNESSVARSALHASEMFVLDFIEQTDCLDLEISIVDTNNPEISYGPNGSQIITINPSHDD